MLRTMFKVLALTAALGGISVWAQQAQTPDPATMVQHRVNFLANKLGLSSAQQQQAITIFTTEMSGMESLHGQMRSAHQALQSAVSKGDNAAIDQAASTIGNLTAQATAAHAKADAQFFQILTADQQARFTQIESHGPPRGFGGGPGWRGGAPPQ